MYAYVGDVYPFIVLEIVWAFVAFMRLIDVSRKKLNHKKVHNLNFTL